MLRLRSLGPITILIATGLSATDGAAQAPPGEAAYASSCASCHGGPAAIISRLGSLDDPARIAQLDRFLARHYARTPEQRRAIIEYLASGTRR